MAKLLSKSCPNCGANISVPPHATDIQCRYCRHAIHIERRPPPPAYHPFGTPGGVPSATLYIDPNEVAKAGRTIGVAVAIIAVAILGGVLGAVALFATRPSSPAKKQYSFPLDCKTNEVIQISGNWEGNGPIIAFASHNCRIKITSSKLKGTTLLDSNSSNVELTLENTTVETTGPLVKSGVNTKIRVTGGSLKSAKHAFDAQSSFQLTLENTTVESTGGSVVKSSSSFKLDATNTKLIAKANAIDVESSARLKLDKASEVTSQQVAIKATSSCDVETEGGKIDGKEGAIVGTSSCKIVGKGTTFSSAEKAIALSSSNTIDLTDGAVTSQTETAIETDSVELRVAGTKVTGAQNGVIGKNGLKVRMTKKASIVGTSGTGIESGTNGQLTLDDGSVEGTRAIKVGTNTKVKLGAPTRVTGRRGGIVGETNIEIESDGAAIDGGTGPGIGLERNARIHLELGSVKGTPAIQTTYRPIAFSVQGTQLVGAKSVPGY